MADSEDAHLKPKGSHYGGNHHPAYTVLCAVFRAFTILLIVVGVIVLVLWLALQPDDLKVYVEGATLARFDLSPNNTLTYNLTLDVSIRNPSPKVGVYYKRMEAAALYDGSKFGSDTIQAFHQGHKSTAMLHSSFHGQSPAIGSSSAATFEREKGEGMFSITVRIYTRARLKRVVVKGVEYTPKVDCYLRLPVAVNDSLADAGFTRTWCHVESFS